MLGFLPGSALSRRSAARAGAAPAPIAAHENPGGLGCDRDDADVDLPTGDALRLASHRTLSGAAVGPAAGAACCSPATRWVLFRFRCASTRRCCLARPTVAWRLRRSTMSRRQRRETGTARGGAGPADHHSGSRADRLPAPRCAGQRCARSGQHAGGQSAGRQRARRGRAGGGLSRTDARGRSR